MIVNGGGSPFYLYKNFAKNSNSGFASPGGDIFPSYFDNNQYPTQNPTLNIGFPVSVPPVYSGNWILSFLGEGTIQIIVSPTAIISDPAGARVSAGSTLTVRSNSNSIAKFTGSISGTTLSSGAPTNGGTIAIGQPLIGFGVLPGTTITGGSGTTWTVSISQNVASTTMISGQTRIVFTLPSMSSLSLGYPGTFSTNFSNIGGSGSNIMSSMQGLILCRCSAPYGNGGLTKSGDEVAVESRDLTQMFNDDSIAIIKSLNAKVWRCMGWQGINGSSQASIVTAMPVDQVSYAQRFPPACWAGTISGTNGQYTCSNAPGSPGTLTEGEQIIGTFTNAMQPQVNPSAVVVAANTITFTVADTSTMTNGQYVFCHVPGVTNSATAWTSSGLDSSFICTIIDGVTFSISGTFTGTYTSGAYTAPGPSINVGGRGRKPIVTTTGVQPSTSFAGGVIAANSTTVLTYDSILFGGAWIVSSPTAGAVNGVTGSVPIEVAVALCNKLNMDLWWNFPAFMPSADAVAQGIYVRDHLNGNLSAFFEWCNEVWNFSGAISQQTQFHVQKGTHYGFGLANNAGNAALWGMLGLKVAQVFSGIGAAWTGTQVGLHRVIATQAIANSNTGLYTGATLKSTSTPYWSLVGVDYSVAGNRPVDYCEHLAIAPYFQGALSPNVYTGSVQAGDYPTRIAGWTTAADNYALGTADAIDLALQWLDNDIRQGTYAPVALGSVNSSGVFTTASGTCTANHLFTNTNIQLTTSSTLPSQLAANTLYKVTVTNDAAGTFTLSPYGTDGSPLAAITSLTGGSLLGISFGIANGGTLAANLQLVLPSINTNAVTYGKTVVFYEGGQSSWYPTTTNCTNMGISTAYTQKFLNLVIAYQQSKYLYQVTIDSMAGFKSFSKVILNCQLQIIGINAWSLLQSFVPPVDGTSSSFNGDINCAQNQSWPACVAFNS